MLEKESSCSENFSADSEALKKLVTTTTSKTVSVKKSLNEANNKKLKGGKL